MFYTFWHTSLALSFTGHRTFELEETLEIIYRRGMMRPREIKRLFQWHKIVQWRMMSLKTHWYHEMTSQSSKDVRLMFIPGSELNPYLRKQVSRAILVWHFLVLHHMYTSEHHIIQSFQEQRACIIFRKVSLVVLCKLRFPLPLSHSNLLLAHSKYLHFYNWVELWLSYYDNNDVIIRP